ncbi:FHA domain-containing protein [Caenimonas sedimenti]|uniref:FHA domain-containing protein n=1 Tax=Caenimonas sedimenti TaxID=2596921 RepID=A0A562ZNX7_9BURK|nr:adenylate/guanylate cyclase domain-containing protein [Caenimonas sedimenti]TWO70270.1 FHA domain-containing protein [Caenimonas sedimenti]
MTARTTVMFADLTGSTGVFEALGNEAATQTITGLTNWIGQVCQQHHGRVVKTLGDGVLALFPDGENAIEAVVHMQREHEKRKKARGPAHLMDLQVGLDCGEIVEVDGDCYGDAVNVASRMADLSGGRQIWATDSVTGQVEYPAPGVRFHALGNVTIRGKAQQRKVFRVEWEDLATDMMTLPGYAAPKAPGGGPLAQGLIELTYLDQCQEFPAENLPVHMGRAREAEFVVNDRHVSRLHARIEWRNPTFVLVDLSSFGTSVRFTGAQTVLTLRRDECVLHDSGEIALAPSFDDLMVPTVNFSLAVGPGAKR